MSREYLLPLKDSKNIIVCKPMFLSTLNLKSHGMITEILPTQRQSYNGAIAPSHDCRVSRPPWNKCDADVILLHIKSYNSVCSHYKLKNAPYKSKIVNKENVRKLSRKQRKQQNLLEDIL